MHSTILSLVHEPHYYDPHHILHTPSAEVPKSSFLNSVSDFKGQRVASNIKDFAHILIKTMRHHKGLGLSAVQVGVQLKIIVLDINLNENNSLRNSGVVMVNARVINRSAEIKDNVEGCLSFGNIYPKIYRSKEVEIKYLDLDQKEQTWYGSDDIMVACVQHEIDHTEGRVFTDRISNSNERNRQLKKYYKWRRKQT